MRYIIPVERIRETETHRDLVKQKESIKIQFLENRKVREIITNAFMINRNTGSVPPHITGINLKVVKDLIVLDEIDKAREVTPEVKEE